MLKSTVTSEETTDWTKCIFDVKKLSKMTPRKRPSTSRIYPSKLVGYQGNPKTYFSQPRCATRKHIFNCFVHKPRGQGFSLILCWCFPIVFGVFLDISRHLTELRMYIRSIHDPHHEINYAPVLVTLPGSLPQPFTETIYQWEAPTW